MYPNPPWNLLPSPPAAFSFHHCLRLLLFLHLILLPAHCEVTDFRVFSLMGHQEGSHASVRFARETCCSCVNVISLFFNSVISESQKKKPQYEAPVDETVWFIFLHHTCECVCVCVCQRESVCVCVYVWGHASDACVYFLIAKFLISSDMLIWCLWTMAAADCFGSVMGSALDTQLL